MNEPSAGPLAWVNGSDAPEKTEINLGFMALSDCASVVVAATQGFAQPYGLTLNLKRQSSWANLRDKLVSGELDAAHSLYGLVYAVHLGIGGIAATDMAVLMGLNQNGQSINLSPGLQALGVTSPEALDRHVHQSRPRLTFAQTFPTGTHAMWLYYWLASQGIHPLQDVDSVVVPPPQMVAHLQAGRIDGFCVGEPWSASAVKQNLGFTLATTQAIWPDHPEKSWAAPAPSSSSIPIPPAPWSWRFSRPVGLSKPVARTVEAPRSCSVLRNTWMRRSIASNRGCWATTPTGWAIAGKTRMRCASTGMARSICLICPMDCGS